MVSTTAGVLTPLRGIGGAFFGATSMVTVAVCMFLLLGFLADVVSAHGQDLRGRPFERQCEKRCESRGARCSPAQAITNPDQSALRPRAAGYAVVNRTGEQDVNSRSLILDAAALHERRDLRREPRQQLLRLLEQRL